MTFLVEGRKINSTSGIPHPPSQQSPSPPVPQTLTVILTSLSICLEYIQIFQNNIFCFRIKYKKQKKSTLFFFENTFPVAPNTPSVFSFLPSLFIGDFLFIFYPPPLFFLFYFFCISGVGQDVFPSILESWVLFFIYF